MKRLFTFSVLMMAFVMNAVAWEPVIKETHWFGMHEYYESPVLGITTTNLNGYINNAGFKTSEVSNEGSQESVEVLGGWNKSGSQYSTTGIGHIGTCKIDISNTVFTSTTDGTHTNEDYCIGLEARWQNNNVAFTQTASIPAGHYSLSFDVQNVNSSTTISSPSDYDDFFFVQVGSTKHYEDHPNNQPTWITNSNQGWLSHTISFDTDGTQDVIISLGYGIKNGAGNGTQDYELAHTPALFVSNLQLTVRDNSSDAISKINWGGTGNQYIESITVIKDWTGQTPLQQPKTSYYSWLDHSKLRFSVNVPGNWGLGSNDNSTYNGLGLKNTASGATNFWIHDLKQGDRFNIEYYRVPNPTSAPYLVTGAVDGLTETVMNGNNVETQGSDIYGANSSGPAYYTMSADGDVQINIPSGTVIRSVTIIHKNYKKASVKVERMTAAEETQYGGIGYRCTMNSAGVLEDKRGAVPYITMRFGAENDMAFIRDLGNGKFGASCIIDATNDFDPATAALQEPYRGKTAEFMKKWLAGKEWSIFTTNLDENGKEIFNDIYPLYGSYYYFFPEVNGKLIVEFYCEGSEETPAFWYKRRADGTFPQVVNQPGVTKVAIKSDGTTTSLSGNSRTNGLNFYRFEIDVEKGGIYYLCSLPTNINHEHPIIRLTSYAFVPAFRLDPLWYVATDAEKTSGTIAHAAELNQDFVHDQGDVNSWSMTWECLGNIKSATPYFDENSKVLKFKDIVYKSTDDATLNDGGVVIVNMSCASGQATYVLTVPYSAEKAVVTTDANSHSQRVRDTDNTRNPNGKEVKKWDFFSTVYSIGQYKNPSSQLYQEIHKTDGLTADWVNTFMNLHDNGSEPIFKSVYDMEGDNAHMLAETEGLIFLAHSNHLGIYNENDPSTSEFRDRYIGFMGEPGIDQPEIWVPNLKQGDRIVVKMGRYGESSDGEATAIINIENATDAIGNPISGDYVLGGSHKLEDGQDQSIPYGEYHFISTGGHFKIKVKDAKLLKLYSIVIYKNSINPDNILTENSVLGSNREILYTDRDNNMTKNMLVNLHHWGLAETQRMLTVDNKFNTGRFKAGSPTFSTTDDHHFTCTPAHDKFGSFRARVGVVTRDANKSYVTDYADHDMAVGYRETKPYPYTWDFTDLRTYVTGQMDNGTEKNVSVDDLKVWNDYNFRVSSDEVRGTLFVSGSQLYADQTMFPETAGIGIYHHNNDAKRNSVMTMTDGGLQVNDSRATSSKPLFWNFDVPEVKAAQAVYVHAKAVSGSKISQAKYALNMKCLDLYGVDEGRIPTGWTCSDGTEVHNESSSYSTGPRVFQAMLNNTAKALYWRNSQAIYGYSPDGQSTKKILSLTPGSYQLKFTMAAWKGVPQYKVAIFNPTTNENVAESTEYTAAPYAKNGDEATIYDISGAEQHVLNFEIETEGNYYINFIDQTSDGGLHEFLLLQCDITTPQHEFEYTATDAGGDVFAMMLPEDATTSDVNISLQDYEVNKIAVAADRKTVNDEGWNTESRDHAIDPSLLPYMTGKDFRTYAAFDQPTELNGVNLIKLTRIDGVNSDGDATDEGNKKVINAAVDDNVNASIIRCMGSADIFGDGKGFHLFVPDMHDAGSDLTGNLLKAQLTKTSETGVVPRQSGSSYNYAFTNKYKYVDDKGEALKGRDGVYFGKQAFYLIMASGASSNGNQAYLQLGQNVYDGSAPARLMLYIEGEEDENGEATGIATVESNGIGTLEDDVRFYNLNGQQLSGKPNRSGLYIVNGKKILIKNK